MQQPRLPSTRITGDDKTTFIGKLARNASLVRWLARSAARFAPAVLTFGKTTLVFRWADVVAVCEQDAAFTIAPVNQSRIESVSGPFILGMDRSTHLFAQRRNLYSAMQQADMAPVRKTLELEAERQLALAFQQKGFIDVVNDFARPVAGRVAVALFGIAGPTEADLLRVARAVFHETFLNLGADARVRDVAIAAGRELRDWVTAEIAARRQQARARKDVLGGLLLQVDAGQLSETEAANIVSGLLVGAIDTTATCVANIMTELLADNERLTKVQKDRDNSQRLWAWCQEILRRRPHNPLVVRQAATGATIAGRAIPEGNRVFAITLSAMQDARVFASPSKLDPSRPEKNYLHFGRGLHLCAGRHLNAIQITYLVARLLQHRPTRRGTLKFWGPFPDELVVGLERQTP